ncbi:MAG: hypothetical protein M1823_005681 [Watsoniomyces obsoletus]|nr:MAG: hypothetical protein M1823_005681 [Watsoniomyces obsoletus]
MVQDDPKISLQPTVQPQDDNDTGPVDATPGANPGIKINVEKQNEKDDVKGTSRLNGMGPEEKNILMAKINRMEVEIQLLKKENHVKGAGSLNEMSSEEKNALLAKINLIEIEIELLRVKFGITKRPEEISSQSKGENGKNKSTCALEDSNKESDALPSQGPAIIPEVRRVNWAGFKNQFEDDNKKYAVDVLIGKPKFFWQRTVEERRGKRSLEPPEDLKGKKEMPERIRINSIPIISTFWEITGGEWSLDSIVFLYPFKFFVRWEGEIRQWLSRLDGTWGPSKTDSSTGTISTRSTEADAQSGPDRAHGAAENSSKQSQSKFAELADSLEAYQHLDALMKYLDECFYPVISRFRSGSCKKVHFGDLWYLFRPGDEVLVTSFGKSVGDPSKASKSGQPRADPQDNTSNRQHRSERQTVWRVFEVGGGRPNLSPSNPFGGNPSASKRVNSFQMALYYIDFDGREFGPTHTMIKIEPFTEEQEITSLDVVPLRFIRNRDAIRRNLELQGERFKRFTEPTHQLYAGPTLTHHPSGSKCQLVSQSEDIDGHVIVDFTEALRSDSQWTLDLDIPEPLEENAFETLEEYPVIVWKDKGTAGPLDVWNDRVYYDQDVDRRFRREYFQKDRFLSAWRSSTEEKPLDVTALSPSELVLLPNRVCAFILRRRRFALLRLDRLQDVHTKERGWNDLKLPRGHKRMIEAQVKMHFRLRRSGNVEPKLSRANYDLVEGKGQGMIILLHGTPGVGKTTTAECLAENIGRPLYPITCGDLGVTAAEVERSLNITFTLAQAWDCVLLLDEADIFLAHRTRTDLKRNAVVSVFLRELEYYTGILFLTTNRLGTFDEAFIHRIQTAFYYPPLNKEQTEAIWKMNMERTRERKANMTVTDEGDIWQYAIQHFNEVKARNDTPWNGRQITSAFRTATALAEFEAQGKDESILPQQTTDGFSHASTSTKPETAAVGFTLHIGHFRKVVNASNQFESYLKATRGASIAEEAWMNRDRDDNFTWPTYHEAPHQSSFPHHQSPPPAQPLNPQYHTPYPAQQQQYPQAGHHQFYPGGQQQHGRPSPAGMRTSTRPAFPPFQDPEAGEGYDPSLLNPSPGYGLQQQYGTGMGGGPAGRMASGLPYGATQPHASMPSATTPMTPSATTAPGGPSFQGPYQGDEDVHDPTDGY